MLKYSCSIILLALTLQLHAQDRIENDSTHLRFLPTGIRIGTDMLSIAKSYYSKGFSGWEVNADADIYRRYYLTADYGSVSTNYNLGNGVYNSDGKYFRVGLDINFLLKDVDRNMFFLGFRRGHANYTDYTDYTYTPDPNVQAINPGLNIHAENSNAIANWNELTIGLRIKVWKFIWMGATGRLKFSYRGKNQDDLQSYDVPGYGKTFKNNWYGLNYQIFFRIPVREDKAARLLKQP